MKSFDQTEPLSETELDRLNEFLKSYVGGKAMNIEEVDGFFSALIAGPEIVMPSEYLRELFGSETSETHAFSTLAEANEILGLLMRHWNSIAGTLSRGDAYLPLLLKDENGLERGNEWARGFVRGTSLRYESKAMLTKKLVARAEKSMKPPARTMQKPIQFQVNSDCATCAAVERRLPTPSRRRSKAKLVPNQIDKPVKCVS
jgi:yecA family protein